MATRIHFVSFVAILAVAAVTLPDKADAAVYTVGNAAGWTVPAGGSSYAAWAANLTFKVGDSLVFNFPNGIHDVAKVTKSAYDNCNTTAPISLRTVGPASVILNSTGQHYFICTFSQHCPLGQKLAINVSTASTPPSPPTPTPTPSPKPSPRPSPSSTPTPSPSSSSSPKRSPSPSQTPPTPTPSSSPVPTPTPTPGRGTPAPAPNGVSGGPPAPPPANTPGASSSPSGTPAAPQPPSSAPRRAIATLFVVAMSIVVGAMF